MNEKKPRPIIPATSEEARWREYERRKRQLLDTWLEPGEYEQAIRELARELRV